MVNEDMDTFEVERIAEQWPVPLLGKFLEVFITILGTINNLNKIWHLVLV